MVELPGYLRSTIDLLEMDWPGNRLVNIVCHGHSVPAGYFATPTVETFNAYPHLLHLYLKEKYPNAVINVIVTARGGENSVNGAMRFEHDVLSHQPDVITLDYSLNDRNIGLDKARQAWIEMILSSQKKQIKVLLLTPTPDLTQLPDAIATEGQILQQHAKQVRELAEALEVGLVDSLMAFEKATANGLPLQDLLSWVNHPNRAGHELVARELIRWF